MTMNPTWRRRRKARAAVAQLVMCQTSPDRLHGEPPQLELSIAQQNAVGLEYASRFPEATELLSGERKKAQQFTETMHGTSALLNERGVEHIYIKYNKLYDYYDSNADVVVRGDDWDLVRGLLEREGYVPHVMFKEPDKIMFDKAGHVSIHLHPGVTWNGVPYFDMDDLWTASHVSADGPWRELSATHNLLINLAHNLFENYVLSLGEVLFFTRFLESQDVDFAEAEEIAVSNGWGHGFRHALQQVCTLVEAWRLADRSQSMPGWLVDYPYRIPLSMLAPTYAQRVMHQLRESRFRTAGRELYAYPTFYMLKRRHDLPGL